MTLVCQDTVGKGEHLLWPGFLPELIQYYMYPSLFSSPVLLQ